MSKPDWQSVEAHFHQISQLPESERAEAIAKLAQEDETLANEVASLIGAADDHQTLAEVADHLGLGENSYFSGKKIGAYRILHQLGSGGTSSVYLAVRDDRTYHRQVALKLLNPGFQSREFLELFQREQQILAGLNHPYIAKLLDAGRSQEGLPYLVTEYVEGTPLDIYCNSRNLKLHERLQVFFKVCEAVIFAHQNLIIHRDLKPGNILVTADGEPMLLDFGFAKIINPHLHQKGTASQVWMRMLTPAYASPEQFQGQMMTTASDVYSLGVILYQLLSGCRPYDLKDCDRSEIEKLICEKEPQRPSQACLHLPVADAKEKPFALGASRERVSRQLRGDLDAIVQKAIRKEPNHRYASVADLLDDLKHHLAKRPVLARKGSVNYRAGKFVRRNRGILAVALILMGIMATFFLAQARQSQYLSKALEEAHIAQRNTDEAFEYLADLFRLPDPLEGLGGSLTAREILDRGAIQIFENLEEQPGAKVKLILVMGEVYKNLGLYKEALALLDRGMPLAESQVISPIDLSNYEYLYGLAALSQGQLEKGQKYLQLAYDRKLQLLGEGHPELARILLELARVKNSFGRYAEAKEDLDLGESILANASDHDPELGFRLAIGQATVENYFGQYDMAIARLNSIRARAEAEYGDNHPILHGIDIQLGLNFKRKGDLPEAEKLYRRVVEQVTTFYGPDHPSPASYMVYLGALLHQKAQFPEAESLYLKAIGLQSKFLEPNHDFLLTTRANLASLYYGSKDFPKAASQFRELVTAQEESLGVGHPHVCRTRSNLAMTLNRLGERTEAESLFRYNLALLKSQGLTTHDIYLLNLQNLGGQLVSNGSFDAALPYLQQVDSAMRERGNKDLRFANNLSRLGFALSNLDQANKAEPLLDEAGAIYEKLLDADDWRLSVIQIYRGHCIYSLGRVQEALDLFATAYSNALGYLGDDHVLIRAVNVMQKDSGVLVSESSQQKR